MRTPNFGAFTVDPPAFEAALRERCASVEVSRGSFDLAVVVHGRIGSRPVHYLRRIPLGAFLVDEPERVSLGVVLELLGLLAADVVG